jgi:hypothetical protein
MIVFNNKSPWLTIKWNLIYYNFELPAEKKAAIDV